MDDVARAEEALVAVMRVERHRHDRYALQPTRGPYTMECKCGRAFVITPGSLTLYEQWCHHVETRVLAAAREVTVETTCSTCGGRRWVEHLESSASSQPVHPCPDCSNGIVSRLALAVLMGEAKAMRDA